MVELERVRKEKGITSIIKNKKDHTKKI